jgi:hypothetical protein
MKYLLEQKNSLLFLSLRTFTEWNGEVISFVM